MSFILQPNVSHFFQDTRNDVCCFLQIHLVHTLVNQHLPKFVITDTHFIPPSGDLSSFESPSRSFSLIITLSTFLSRVWVQRRSAEDWQTSCRPSNIRQAPHQRAAHSQGSSLLTCFSSCPCLAFSKHPLFFHGIRENSLPIIDHAHGFCKSVHAPSFTPQFHDSSGGNPQCILLAIPRGLHLRQQKAPLDKITIPKVPTNKNKDASCQ